MKLVLNTHPPFNTVKTIATKMIYYSAIASECSIFKLSFKACLQNIYTGVKCLSAFDYVKQCFCDWYECVFAILTYIVRFVIVIFSLKIVCLAKEEMYSMK